MSTIQMLNMTFDVWSALFNVILIVGVIASRAHNPLQSRPLVGALLANMCVNIAEVLAYVFRGDVSPLGYWMVRISNFSVFLCNHLLLLFAAIFVIRTIERDGKVVSITFKRVLMAIIILGIVLLALSRVFGFYYGFDDQNRYVRTDGYAVMLALIFTADLALLALTIMNRDRLTRIERIAFIMFETLPAVAMVAQLFTYGISLTTFAGTLTLTMMFMAYELEVSRAVVENERRMLRDVVSTLAEAVDAKDTYTRGHSGRVAHYSQMLCEKMGLSREETVRIMRIATLHDVGKISIPDAVLNKPGRLTDEEFDLIKSHTERGGDILGKVKSMPDLSMGARWHHERYDGKGYPDGLAGEEIPLEARIICVADCYDAMTSDRVYRDHLPQDVVRQEIVKGMGAQFDPTVAEAMLDIIDEDEDYLLRE